MQDVGEEGAEPTATEPAPLSLRRAFVAGVLAIVRSPIRTSALALCSVAAGFSLVLAVGLLLLPWVLSALSALQLRRARGRLKVSWRQRGGLLWIEGLGLLFLLGLGALCMLCWDLPMPEVNAPFQVRLGVEGLWRSPALLFAALLALPVREVWMWAPTAMLDGAPGPLEGMVRSARLCEAAPRSRARRLAVLAPLLPGLGVAVLTSGAMLFDAPGLRVYRFAVVFVGISVAVALARGWVTASYLALQPARKAGRTAVEPGAPGTWLALSGVLTVGLLLAVFSSFVPRPPEEGPLPEGAEPIVRLDEASNRGSARVPDTSVTVYANHTGVKIEAADGGGAGLIPLPSDSPVTSVLLAREGPTYWLQISAEGQPLRRLPFDADGVRLDEQLTARFARSCPWALRIPLLLSVLVFGLALTRQVRRSAGLPTPEADWIARLGRFGLWVPPLTALAIGLATTLR